MRFSHNLSRTRFRVLAVWRVLRFCDCSRCALILSTRGGFACQRFWIPSQAKWEVRCRARLQRRRVQRLQSQKTQDAPNGKHAKSRSTQVVREIASRPIPKAEPLNLEMEIARRNTSPDRRIDLLLEEMDDLKKSCSKPGPSDSIEVDSESGLYGELVSRGIDADLADRLIAKASETDSSPGEIRNVVRRLLADMLLIEPPAEFRPNRASSAYLSDRPEWQDNNDCKDCGSGRGKAPQEGGADYHGPVASGQPGSAFAIRSAAERSSIYMLGSFDVNQLDPESRRSGPHPRGHSRGEPSDLARLAKLEEVLKLPEARVNLVIERRHARSTSITF